MSTASPVIRAEEEKAKKQKRLLAILSVVLLALLGFELPKMLGGDSTSTAAPAETAIVSTTPGSPLAGAPTSLPDTDRVSVAPDSGQLISFGLFKSKDPFVPQLSTLASPTPQTPQASPVATAPVIQPPVLTTPSAPVTVQTPVTPVTPVAPPTATTPARPVTPVSTVPTLTPIPVTSTPVTTVPTRTTTTPRTSTTPRTTTTPAAPATAPTSASISTNGACELVPVNGKFPGTEDIFRVVSIARDGKTAKIAVVGGAYDSGDASVTITLGERVTLVNTADGTRYVILLRARCDGADSTPESTTPIPPVAPTATTTTSPTTTVAPPAPVSTVTTPIVTDALDTTTPTP